MQMGEREGKQEDKVADGKGGSVECGDVVIKTPSPLFAFKGFWETAPR